MAKIIPEGMYDSEKWASDYVEVRGNYQYPPGEYGQFEVATRRGGPPTTQINKELLRASRNCKLASTLLTIPSEERDAPTILQYKPTYGGRIRKKEADKEEASAEDLPAELLPSVSRPLRGIIREPTEGSTPEEEANMPPRSMKDVLQQKMEAREKDKAKGLAKKTGASGASGSAPSKKIPPPPTQKRPPPAPPSPKEAQAGKKQKTTARSEAGDGASVAAKGKETSEENVPWAPSFVTADKKQILKSDSLRDDPSLALTLSGVGLPRDIQHPPSLKAALTEYYYHAARASHSIMSVNLHLSEYEKKKKLLLQSLQVNKDSAEEYKKSWEESEAARQSLEAQVFNLNELVKGLQEAAGKSRAEGKDEGLAEGRALGHEEMKVELEKEYNRGYYEAQDAAAEELAEAQAEMLEEQHKASFMLGYNTGLDDLGAEADDERRMLVEVPPRSLAEAQQAENEQLETEQQPDPAVVLPGATTEAGTTPAPPSEDPTLPLFPTVEP